MIVMRTTILLLLVAALAVSVSAQSNLDALAVIGGRTFTAQDLDPAIAAEWSGLPARISEARAALLDRQIEHKVLELEAKKRGITYDELIAAEVTAKVPEPTEAEISKIYEDNKADIGPVPLAEVRPQIAKFLKQQAERDAYRKFADDLVSSYKIVKGKDINSQGLLGSDIVAMVDTTSILYYEFTKKNGLALYELEANTTDEVINALTQVVDASVYTIEADSLGIATSDLIAREITDKMKDYSDAERERLESELKKKLYAKYRVNFFIQEPAPYIQQVSVDDDPYQGKRIAPVTVIMFTDFQCPACSGVHPVLKRVISEFGDSVKFVVRDFPLTSIHDHAFAAAVAANAANRQGKFFEYAELLYNNQDSLDDESLKKYAEEAGLNVGRFEKDMRDPEIAAEVKKDIEDGKGYGVTGTPSIFVNGYKIRTLSESSFRKAISRAIGKR
jgi:protein-disulfide isomerase